MCSAAGRHAVNLDLVFCIVLNREVSHAQCALFGQRGGVPVDEVFKDRLQHDIGIHVVGDGSARFEHDLGRLTVIDHLDPDARLLKRLVVRIAAPGQAQELIAETKLSGLDPIEQIAVEHLVTEVLIVGDPIIRNGGAVNIILHLHQIDRVARIGALDERLAQRLLGCLVVDALVWVVDDTDLGHTSLEVERSGIAVEEDYIHVHMAGRIDARTTPGNTHFLRALADTGIRDGIFLATLKRHPLGDPTGRLRVGIILKRSLLQRQLRFGALDHSVPNLLIDVVIDHLAVVIEHKLDRRTILERHLQSRTAGDKHFGFQIHGRIVAVSAPRDAHLLRALTDGGVRSSVLFTAGKRHPFMTVNAENLFRCQILDADITRRQRRICALDYSIKDLLLDVVVDRIAVVIIVKLKRRAVVSRHAHGRALGEGHRRRGRGRLVSIVTLEADLDLLVTRRNGGISCKIDLIAIQLHPFMSQPR